MTMKRQIIFYTFVLALLALAVPSRMAAQQPSDERPMWAAGFQVGVGGMVPTSSLSDDLKACALFAGGLTGEWNNLRLKAGIAYAQPSFKNDNPYGVFDSQGP